MLTTPIEGEGKLENRKNENNDKIYKTQLGIKICGQTIPIVESKIPNQSSTTK